MPKKLRVSVVVLDRFTPGREKYLPAFQSATKVPANQRPMLFGRATGALRSGSSAYFEHTKGQFISPSAPP